MGLDSGSDWKSQLEKLSPNDCSLAQWQYFLAKDRHLDLGDGELILAKPSLAKIVADSLHYFDEKRYFLTDFVVMPNHVHLLVAFPEQNLLLKQCTEWKRFTARQINSALNRNGAFWQTEQFDHLIRSEERFLHYQRYIAENPQKAKLKSGEFFWYSTDVTAEASLEFHAPLGETNPAQQVLEKLAHRHSSGH